MNAERVDLDAVAERVRQASEGPWEPSPKVSDAVIAPHADRRPGWDDEDDGYYGGPVVGESMLPADREFIAHARQDVEEMERELRVAREELAAVRPLVQVARRWSNEPEMAAALRVYDWHADPSTHQAEAAP
jgi:hypothetical protein